MTEHEAWKLKDFSQNKAEITLFDQNVTREEKSCRYTTASALTSERTLAHRRRERPQIGSGVPGGGPGDHRPTAWMRSDSPGGTPGC